MSGKVVFKEYSGEKAKIFIGLSKLAAGHPYLKEFTD
jgi:hypothetical protein